MVFKGWVPSQVNRSHMLSSENRFWRDLKLCSWRLQWERAEEVFISSYNPEDKIFLHFPSEKGFWHQPYVCRLPRCGMEHPRAAQLLAPHYVQAAVRTLPPAWEPGADLHLSALAAHSGFGTVNSQLHRSVASVLQKCQYWGLTFINWGEEEIMLAKYCQILQIND